MLITILNNTSPYAIANGNAIKEAATTIKVPTPQATSDVCMCQYVCDYVERVFADVGGADYKNDYNTFVFKRLIATDTVDIELWKNRVKLADITDDTYGTLVDGYSGTDIPAQEYYKVFTIDWEKVMNVSGSGRYQLKASLDIIGTTNAQESQIFKLEPYSDIEANGTVRIEAVQNGNIIRSDFDFTGLNLSFATRIRGDLRLLSPETEQENHLKQNYGFDQIQSKLKDKWELQIKEIPNTISEAIIYNYMLANTIELTDYNILNEKIYRNIPLVFEEVEKDRVINNINSSFLLKFTDRNDDIIKRNY